LAEADWGLNASTALGFKKATEASIPLKMYLKSLTILEKTSQSSISLKMSSKIIEIFIKAPRF
jgi:hypothetical protein